MQYRFLYALIIALAIMLVLAWLVWLMPGMHMRWEEPRPVFASIPHITEDQPENGEDDAFSGDAANRPPFWASRRPVSPEAADAADDEENDIDGAVVVGLLRRDDLPVVIIKHADGRTGRVAAGQEFGGWKLISIDDDVANFEHADGRKQSLRIVRRRVEDLPQRSAEQPLTPQNGMQPGQPPRPQTQPAQQPQPAAAPPQRARPQQRLPQQPRR